MEGEEPALALIKVYPFQFGIILQFFLAEGSGLPKCVSHKLRIAARQLLHKGILASCKLLELVMFGLWVAFELRVLVAIAMQTLEELGDGAYLKTGFHTGGDITTLLPELECSPLFIVWIVFAGLCVLKKLINLLLSERRNTLQ
jgi:hypothetical protein